MPNSLLDPTFANPMTRRSDIANVWQRISESRPLSTSRGMRFLEKSRYQLASWWESRPLHPQRRRSARSSGRSIARRIGTIDLATLEPRILFSASPIPIDLVTVDSSPPPAIEVAPVTPADIDNEASGQNVAGGDPGQAIQDLAASGPLEMVFVDTSVRDYQMLLDDLRDQVDAKGTELQIFLIDESTDGVQSITDVLSASAEVGTVHLISHASDDALILGNHRLTSDSLIGRAGDIARWADGLTADADILIYGCNLAANSEGREIVQSIAALTGADVAASDDDTGHVDYGGDWELEYQVGRVDSVWVPDVMTVDLWHAKLAIIDVDTFHDVVDAGDGFTSLREAIIRNNDEGGGNTIRLSSGTYLLTIGGSGEDLSQTGDLDILENVTILGAGADRTVIDASGTTGLHRVFDMRSGVATMNDVTITGGHATSGGGVTTRTGTTLDLTDVEVIGNESTALGGGIVNRGTMNMVRVTLADNVSASQGGAFYADTGSFTAMTNVTISGNSSQAGGAIFNDGATIGIVSSTIADNSTGVFQTNGGTTSLRSSILSNFGANANESLSSLGHNIDGDGTAGLVENGDLTADPMLLALGDYGGSTRTQALAAGSLAIDAGTGVETPTTDQRGVPRVGTADIGSFEATSQLTDKSTFRVNNFDTGYQNTTALSRGSRHAVATDELGNYVIVWTSDSQDGDDDGVYGQRFNAQGDKVGNEFLVNQHTDNDQFQASVAMNDAGDFVVTWTSEDQGDQDFRIYARQYHAEGTVGDEFQVNTSPSGAHRDSDVAIDDAGNFVIVWNSDEAGSYVTYRRFDADGTPLGDQVGIESDTSQQADPTIAMAADGRFVIAWDYFFDVRYMVFDAAGTALGPYAKLSESSVDIVAGKPAVAMADDGTFVIAYQETVVLGSYDVKAQRYDAAGGELGGRIQVNTTTSGHHTEASMAMDSDGDFIVTWTRGTASDPAELLAQKFNSDGTPNGTEFQVDATPDQVPPHASLAMTNINRFVVTWTDQGDSGTEDVFARQYHTGPAWNAAPIVDIGGPYSVAEGQSLFLIAGGSSDPDGDSLTYQWDLDGDTRFDDAGGETATVTWSQLSALGIDDNGTYSIQLMVDDGNGNVRVAVAALTVTNVAPNIVVTGDSGVVAGQLYTLHFAATDPGEDTITSWNIDWGDGNNQTVAGNLSSFTHVFTTAGTQRDIVVTATDEDGTWSANDRSVRVSENAHSLTAVADTFIDNSSVDVNHGASGTLTVDKSGGNIGHQRPLLLFDVSNFPAGTTIEHATLNLEALSLTGGFDVSVYQLLEAWDEGTGDGSSGTANWNERQAGVDWGTHGGSFDGNVIDTYTATAVGTHTWDVTSIVQQWYAGTADNHGLILGSGESGIESVVYASREGTVAPLLQVYFSIENLAPTGVSLDNPVVDENIDTTGGYRVGALTTADPNTGDTFAYQIRPGDDATLFQIGGASNDELWLDAGVLDYETESSYAVTVRSTDQDGLFYDRTFTVTVADADDTAPVIDTAPAFSIDEHVAVGTVLGTLTASDVDTTGPLSGWAIVGGNGAGVFEIDDTTGVITVADKALLDHETSDVLTVQVTVSDSIQTSSAATVTINVNDVNYHTVSVTTVDDVRDSTATTIEELLLDPGADGLVSLREAIIAANGRASSGTVDTITFGTVTDHVIRLASDLPEINDGVLIDGWSHAGHANGQRIVIDGNHNATHGLVLAGAADGSTIRGLTIRNANSSGIEILLGSDGHVIMDNRIGAFDDAGDFDAALGNGHSGIRAGGGSILIGGDTPSLRNVIAGNGTSGVEVSEGSSGVTIRGNLFFGNGQLAIDLGGGGVLGNTLTGVAGNLDSPDVVGASRSGSDLTVDLGFIGTPSSIFTIDVYVTDDPNVSGHGGAIHWISSIAGLTTDGSGQLNLSRTLTDSIGAVGDYVTATATDANGNTSEFAANALISAPNQAPVLDNLESASLGYGEGDENVAITEQLVLTDAENSIESAVVRWVSGFVSGEDVLAFNDTGNITTSFNAATGTLTLSGVDSVANYQAALRSVTYRNTSENPSTSTRVISIQVSDGDLLSNTMTRQIGFTTANVVADPVVPAIPLPPPPSSTSSVAESSSEPAPEPDQPADTESKEDPGGDDSGDSAGPDEAGRDVVPDVASANSGQPKGIGSVSDTETKEFSGLAPNPSVFDLTFETRSAADEFSRAAVETESAGGLDSRGGQSTRDDEGDLELDMTMASVTGDDLDSRQWQAMDELRKEMLGEVQYESIVVGFAVTTAVAVTVGQAVWVINAGYLASSALLAVPAWRSIDPLPVLDNLNQNFDDDDESLDSMLDG